MKKGRKTKSSPFPSFCSSFRAINADFHSIRTCWIVEETGAIDSLPFEIARETRISRKAHVYVQRYGRYLEMNEKDFDRVADHVYRAYVAICPRHARFLFRFLCHLWSIERSVMN